MLVLMLTLTLKLKLMLMLMLILKLISMTKNKPFLKKDKSIIFFLSSIIRNGVLKNWLDM